MLQILPPEHVNHQKQVIVEYSVELSGLSVQQMVQILLSKPLKQVKNAIVVPFVEISDASVQ